MFFATARQNWYLNQPQNFTVFFLISEISTVFFLLKKKILFWKKIFFFQFLSCQNNVGGVCFLGRGGLGGWKTKITDCHTEQKPTKAK